MTAMTTLTIDQPSAPAALTQFRVVYAFLTLNFILPAISYVVSPGTAVDTVQKINAALGGPAWPVESGQMWHMLAVGNVMTLGVMCAMLLVDLRRFYPILPALAFLKGFSSLYSLALGFTHGLPGFFAIFLLDGVTTAAMIFFATRARRVLP
jgi:hypothetical protein